MQVCEDAGVRGYPTIMYYTSETGPEGEKYAGGRDFDALNTFVEEKLSAGCTVGSEADTCDEKESAYVTKMQAKGADAIAKELVRLTELVKSKMTADKKQWMTKRMNILKQF